MQEATATRGDFAVMAARRIAEGDAKAAVHLCAEGIAAFPDYLGGYIVLAQAYDVLQQYDDAYIMRTEAHRRFPWLPWVGPLAETVAAANGQIASPAEPPTDMPAEPVEHHIDDQQLAEQHAVEQHPVQPSKPMAYADVPNDNDVLSVAPSEDHPVEISGVESEQPLIVETPTIEVAQPTVQPLIVEHVETPHTLRLIQTAAPIDDKRIIRSAAVRLIPGLEFTSLRFEGVKQRGRRTIQRLQDPPPFREFHAPVRRRMPAVAPPTTTEQPTRSRPFSLEELAQRLERARMPRPDTGPTLATKPTPEFRPSAEPSRTAAPVVFSETMARIYEAQGSFDLALEVYRALQQQQPERSEHFQSMIDAITAKRDA